MTSNTSVPETNNNQKKPTKTSKNDPKINANPQNSQLIISRPQMIQEIKSDQVLTPIAITTSPSVRNITPVDHSSDQLERSRR